MTEGVNGKACEEAEIRLAGRSYFVKLESGGSAFIPMDKICEALERYDICVPPELLERCSTEVGKQ